MSRHAKTFRYVHDGTPYLVCAFSKANAVELIWLTIIRSGQKITKKSVLDGTRVTTFVPGIAPVDDYASQQIVLKNVQT